MGSAGHVPIQRLYCVCVCVVLSIWDYSVAQERRLRQSEAPPALSLGVKPA